MEKVFITWFSPLLLREKPSSSNNVDEAVKSFSSLEVDIQKLDMSLAKNSLSLQWCTEAIDLLRKMHFQFLQLVENPKVPKSWDRSGCLDEYLKESLNLLDLCNWLKPAVSGMDRYRLTVDFAVKKLYADGLLSDSNKTEIEKLEKEGKKIYGANWKGMNILNPEIPKTRGKDDNTVRVIYVIRSTMTVICKLLFATIFYPISDYMYKEVYCEIPQLKLLSVSLWKLVWCFCEGLQAVKDESRPVLGETKMIERAVLDVKEEVLEGVGADKEKLQKSIDLLKNRCAVLKKGLDMFDAGVNQLFGEVVQGRNKVLGMVTAA